ncbi:MAG: radical SAM protein [candidate division WOR-3 bacterium]|nr:radical SAM protein [candidate division WOR-3 bacterium]
MNLIDPIAKAREMGNIVINGSTRKYYRLTRTGRWYGGIATADCCGCNLKCVFCWSNKPRDNPEKIGEFYSPECVAENLIKCAKENNYRYVRISGNEPTICKEHLTAVLKIINKTKLLFILETNGTLLDDDFVKELSAFNNLHIRVSLKGTTPEEFSMLTGAKPETFDLILDNLHNLVKADLRFNLAVMLSFSPDKNIIMLKERLKKISQRISDNFEEEYVFLYPHVIERLKRSGIRPLVAYTPDGIPKELI